jgi:hypothetical protein
VAGNVTAQRDTICSGTAGNLILAGNSVAPLQWQSGASATDFGSIPGATAGTYREVLYNTLYFRVIASSGDCADTSNVQEIFVPPLLTAYFNSAQTGVRELTFSSDSSAGNIVSYHWDFGDGQTSNEKNPTHTFAKDSTYYVCLTLYDGSNCSYTYCRYCNTTADALANISFNGILTVYPNPFSDNLTIISKGEKKIEAVEIYDVLGRTVFDAVYTTTKTNVSINSHGLVNGIYLLKIRISSVDYVQRLVKQ